MTQVDYLQKSLDQIGFPTRGSQAIAVIIN